MSTARGEHIPGSIDSDPQSAVDRIRRKLRVISGQGGRRSRTIPADPLSRDERVLADATEYPIDVERPQARGDCASMPRPCPFVSCSHHLYADINPVTGSITLNHPDLEVWEMAETCSLDVADRGGITLEELGVILGLTRERIRQIESNGLRNLEQNGRGQLGLPPPRG